MLDTPQDVLERVFGYDRFRGQQAAIIFPYLVCILRKERLLLDSLLSQHVVAAAFPANDNILAFGGLNFGACTTGQENS